MPLKLEHRVRLADARAHLVEIETTVHDEAKLPSPLTLFMPVWTPGSYLVREYARHVEGLTAERDGAALPIRKVRKNAWQCDPGGAHAVTVRYRLYCNELTVRTNHVDDTHAYLNGAATFLAVCGAEQAPSRVLLAVPEGWRVATALPPAAGDVPLGHVGFDAPDLDTLVDCPIEVGTHREVELDVLGVAHRYAVHPAGEMEDANLRRLVADTRTLLETEAKLFGGFPYERYLIQLHLSPRGRGGLEHKTSCTLLASPQSFQSREGYLDLLSLVAHEVFHAWNVKRLRPEGLTPYRYEGENYTRLLWWFEGGTSYYDWRVLRLSGLASVPEYLGHLADEIAYLDATPGRLAHSLEEASFDAWIKLYRPDENSANSTVSYYRKGEVVCALLDMELRARTGGRVGVDHVLRYLWEHHGAREVPVPEDGMLALFERVAEVSLGDVFEPWVRGTAELPYESTLAKLGMTLERGPRVDAPKGSLGLRLRGDGGRVMVASVLRGAAGQRGGIDPGDELVSVGGRRLESTSLDAVLGGRDAGEVVEVVVARDGRTRTLAVALDEARRDRVRISVDAQATPAQRALFAGWLGEAHPAWGNP